MTTETICQAILDWVMDTCSIATGYDHIPAQSTGALPDCIVDAETVSLVESSDIIPFGNIQQAWVKLYQLGISIMVDNSDPDTAAAAVRGYENLLTASLLADGTLQGRVPMVSKRIEYDFTLPFVVRPDGTRGREMTMNITVAELVQEEG